jgi:hypothetical protein
MNVHPTVTQENYNRASSISAGKAYAEVTTRALFDFGDQSSADFLRPAGEAALVSPDSVSWRVFKNPLSLFIGGVAAVIMELAELRFLLLRRWHC